MAGVAVFLPNWIGDVVMATPAIRAARNHFANVRFVAVCKPYVADVLAGSAWFDDVVLLDKKGPKARRFLAALARLRENKVDTAILFPNSFRVALLARLAGCRTAAGYSRYFRDGLLSHRLYPTRDGRGRPKPVPILDDYNRIVQKLGVPDPGHRMELFATALDEAAADVFWNRHGLQRFAKVVGLNPGGAFGAAKHWPAEHFADLARSFVDRHAAGVILLCGPSEREIANRIVVLANRPGVVAMGDTGLSLGLTKAVVRRLSLMVTTDSGPRHFAAAFDVPVVSLFGPTHIGWTETYFAKAVNLQKPMPCGPCQQRVCPLGHHRCMTELAPAEVFAASGELLNAITDDRRPHRHAG